MSALNYPTGIAVDTNGVIYLTEHYGHRIRMIVDGVIYTIDGDGVGTPGTCENPAIVYVASTCEVFFPTGIAVNGFGDVVFADGFGTQIKRISGGYSYVVAGNGSEGYTGTPSNGRNFFSPEINSVAGLDIDLSGRMRFFDAANDIVRVWSGESPLFVQTKDNSTAYEYFYQYDGVSTSYRYPGVVTYPQERTLTVGGDQNQLLVGTGDFNHDGNLDLVWEDQVTHKVVIWYQSGANETGAFGSNGGGCPCTIGFQVVGLEGSPNWHVVAVADFNGDGVPDLVYQNTTTYAVVIWNMTGPWGNIPLSLTYVPGVDNSPWVVVGAADFDGDGTPDLLWQNPTTRQMLVWYMGAQGSSFTAYSVLDQALLGWTCIGTRDFDGNGKPDIFYQNDTTAEVMVWLMGGTGGQDSLNQVFLEYSPPSNWRYIAR